MNSNTKSNGVNHPHVTNAVEQIGPKILKDLGKYPLCVVSIGSGGRNYALGLVSYLEGEGCSVEYAHLTRPSRRLYSDQVKERFVLFVDDNISNGRTHRYIMRHKVPMLEKKVRIKGARFIAPIDIRGLADYSCDPGIVGGNEPGELIEYVDRAIQQLRTEQNAETEQERYERVQDQRRHNDKPEIPDTHDSLYRIVRRVSTLLL